MTFTNISLVGRLVRQPEMTIFNSGRNKTTFTVAINHPGRKMSNGARSEGTSDFLKVEAWGKIAEVAHKFLAKGNQVTVCGPFRVERWVDKEGKDRVTPLVEAQFLALPPRLRVVDQQDSTASSTVQANNTISGSMTFGDDPDESDREDTITLEEEPIPMDTSTMTNTQIDEDPQEYGSLYTG